MTLANLRNQNKMTQENLAKIVGISRVYLSNLEKRKYNPTVDIVIKLAKALNVTEQVIIDCFK